MSVDDHEREIDSIPNLTSNSGFGYIYKIVEQIKEVLMSINGDMCKLASEFDELEEEVENLKDP